MTTITVTSDEDQTTEFKFDQIQSTITVGRRSTNDVCIPDLSVSGSHATFVISADSVILEDLNSTNGTYVNGQIIQRVAINPGDEIIMGKLIIGIKDLTLPDQDSVSGFDGFTPNDGTFGNSDSRSGSEQRHEARNESRIKAESYSELGNKSGSKLGAAGRSAAVTATSANFADRAAVNASKNAELPDKDSEEHFAPATESSQGFSPDPKPDTDENSGTDPSAASNTDSVADTGPDTDTDLGTAKKANEDSSSAEKPAHPLDGLEHLVVPDGTAAEAPPARKVDTPTGVAAKGAVIEIKNGAKSGQILPIDKPVTTLGRPGIQIAAIMRKPHGYYLMHIESNEDCEQPTLNNNPIGDEPVPLHTGDELTVAGIDVEFMLS